MSAAFESYGVVMYTHLRKLGKTTESGFSLLRSAVVIPVLSETT